VSPEPLVRVRFSAGAPFLIILSRNQANWRIAQFDAEICGNKNSALRLRHLANSFGKTSQGLPACSVWKNEHTKSKSGESPEFLNHNYDPERLLLRHCSWSCFSLTAWTLRLAWIGREVARQPICLAHNGVFFIARWTTQFRARWKWR